MTKFYRYSRAQAEADKLEVFRRLRELREAYERGEVDAEGNPLRDTAFSRLVKHSTPVELKR